MILTRQQKLISRAVKAQSNSYEIRRINEESFVDGLPFIDESEKEFISANIQPFSGKESELPEGLQSEDMISIFTTDEVKKGDELIIDENVFRIKELKNWTSHIEAQALRTGENDNVIDE